MATITVTGGETIAQYLERTGNTVTLYAGLGSSGYGATVRNTCGEIIGAACGHSSHPTIEAVIESACNDAIFNMEGL
jgi:hypothetical protein